MMSCISPCMSVPAMSSQSQSGQIQVVFGPMFSGKTTELMRRMKRYKFANYKCLVIKYAKDTRYDKSALATHDKQTLPATSAVDLTSMIGLAHEYDVIGVDEGQFFPDVVSFCEQMADRGKTVIVAALDGTYQRKGFGNILELVPLAESVVKLTAVCMQCYGEASFTKRKGIETEVEVIGGADKYLATCRACYKEPGKTSPCCSPSRRANPSLLRAPPSAEKPGRRLFGKTLENNTMEVSSG